MLAQTCAVLLPNSCNPSMSVKCKTQIPSSAVQGKAAIPINSIRAIAIPSCYSFPYAYRCQRLKTLAKQNMKPGMEQNRP